MRQERGCSAKLISKINWKCGIYSWVQTKMSHRHISTCMTWISRLARIHFISFTCMKGSWKVGMLQRGDSDIGWADLYIIPDRARFQIEKINLYFKESRFSYIQTDRLHWSLRHRVRVLHALEAPSSSSVAGPHNPTSTSSLYFHICFRVNFFATF